MILATIPRFICEAIACRNLGLLTLLLDLAVPPLSLLVILLIGMTFVAGVAVFFGYSSAALAVNATSVPAGDVEALADVMRACLEAPAEMLARFVDHSCERAA
jgi:hypothetical protein